MSNERKPSQWKVALLLVGFWLAALVIVFGMDLVFRTWPEVKKSLEAVLIMPIMMFVAALEALIAVSIGILRFLSWPPVAIGVVVPALIWFLVFLVRMRKAHRDSR